MPVARIERIAAGTVTGRVEPGAEGHFACHDFGSNVIPTRLATLDEVADLLRSRPGSGVRMNPGWGRMTRNLHIDGVRLR